MKPVVTVLPRRKNASPSLRPPSPRTNNALLVRTSPSVGAAANTNQLRNSISGSISVSRRHGAHDAWQPLNTAIKAKAVNSHKKNISPQLDDQFLLNQSADFDAADIEVDHINNIYDPAAQNMLHDFVEAQKHKEFESSTIIRDSFSDDQEEQSDCTSNDTSNINEVSELIEQASKEEFYEDVIAVQLPDPSLLNASDIPLFFSQMSKYMDVLKQEMEKKSVANNANKSPQLPSAVTTNNVHNNGARSPSQIMTIKPNMPTQPVNIAVKKSINNANKPRNNTAPIVASNVRNGAVHPNEKMFYTGNIGNSTSLSSSPPTNSHWASLANAKGKNNSSADCANNKNNTIQLVSPRVKKVTDFGSVDSLSEEHSIGSCNVLCLSEASAFDDISVGSSSSTSTIRSSRSKNSMISP